VDLSHQPHALTPTLRSGSGLVAGDTVKLDYYAVQPVYEEQYGASLTEPAWPPIRPTHQAAPQELRTRHGFMLGGYDEIRHGYSTRRQGRRRSAGALLPSTSKSVRPRPGAGSDRSILTWSDMFDPNHNAKDKFYLWDGNLTGSWARCLTTSLS